MNWRDLQIAPCCTHHLDTLGSPIYEERFEEVLKFHAPGLAPVRLGQAAWHIHFDGSAAYDRRFLLTFGFYDGLSTVVSANGWHHVDNTGEDAYPQRYAWCGNFQEGRCSIREKDGTYRHITPSGETAYEARWRYAGDYRDGVAVVQAGDGRSTHIDLAGRKLHARWFLDLDIYHKGFSRARDEAGWAHIDTAGIPVYKKRFAAVEPFYNGQARVERFDGGLEVIDEAGGTMIELRPALRSEFAALSNDMVGFWKTRAIAAAVELRLVEALPGTEDDLAIQCHLQPDRAGRLLRALGELGLTTRDGTVWRLTTRGNYLRADHPLTLADAAREYAGPFSRMWEALPQALLSMGDWKAPDIFKEVALDEHRLQPHHRMLQSYARHDYPAVVAALDLVGKERLVDAGGGIGAMANLLLDRYPTLEVVVLDLPEIIDQAKRLQSKRTGLEWLASDLFKPWNRSADAVLFARVLHDWDDVFCRQLLRQARAVLPRGGRVFIVEMVLPESGMAGGLCDLHLLMATGGQERTPTEYGRLLATEGFELLEVRALPALPSILVGVAQ